MDKIKEWIYLKYGVEVSKKHVWMMLILCISTVLLAVMLLGRFNFGKKQLIPRPNTPMKNNG